MIPRTASNPGARACNRPCARRALTNIAAPMERLSVRPLSWLTAILGVMCILLSASNAFAQPDPVFDAKGFQQNRDYFSQAPYENIDVVSGGVVLTVTNPSYPATAAIAFDVRTARNPAR